MRRVIALHVVISIGLMTSEGGPTMNYAHDDLKRIAEALEEMLKLMRLEMEYDK